MAFHNPLIYTQRSVSKWYTDARFSGLDFRGSEQLWYQEQTDGLSLAGSKEHKPSLQCKPRAMWLKESWSPPVQVHAGALTAAVRPGLPSAQPLPVQPQHPPLSSVTVSLVSPLSLLASFAVFHIIFPLIIFLGSSHSSVSLLSCHFLCTFFICVCLSLPVSLSFNSCHLSLTDLEHRINGSLGNLRNFSTQYLARDFIPTKSIPSLSGLSITLETIG